jgi:2-hydroxy-3-oxopropionate reductase
MSGITVVGLDVMGSAFANTLLSFGHQVPVWNRNREKAEKLRFDGAQILGTIVDAINESPVLLDCDNNYATTTQFFQSDEAQSVLRGRMACRAPLPPADCSLFFLR